MKEEQPFLQIPIPTNDDWRAYEEWLKKQKQEDEKNDDKRIIIIDL